MRKQRSVFLALVLAMGLGGGTLGLAAPRPDLPTDAPEVDWSHALDVHGRVEDWVKKALAPEDPGTPVPVKGVEGVFVTIRWSGMLMGTGQITGADLNRTVNGVTDLSLCARDATRLALRAAGLRLADAASQFNSVKPEDVKNGVIKRGVPSTLRDTGPLLSVDMQVALHAELIHIDKDAPAGAIYSKYTPNFHGLHMYHFGTDNKIDEVWSWPGQAISTNLSPPSQLMMMVSQLGVSLDRVSDIGRPGGIDTERFEVIHVARPSTSTEGVIPLAELLVRGNRLLPPSTLDSKQIERMADRLTSNLLRRTNSNGTVNGTYFPTTDQFDPPAAGDEDVAFAIYALVRRANYLEKTDPGSENIKKIRDVVDVCMNVLVTKFDKDEARFSPAAAALLLMSLNDGPQFADRKATRDSFVAFIFGCLRGDGFFRDPTPGLDPTKQHPLPAPVQALMVDALAHTYASTREEALGLAVRTSLASIWPFIAPDRIAELPWIVDAQMKFEPLAVALPGAAPTTQPASTQPVANRWAALRKVIGMLDERQVKRPPEHGPADVVGGFQFGPTYPDSTPLVDWHTALAIQTVSMTLSDERLIDQKDRIKWILALGTGERFLNQLMIEDPSTYYMKSPDLALWGVRLNLMDNKLPPASTAAALLATTEFQEGLLKLLGQKK